MSQNTTVISNVELLSDSVSQTSLAVQRLRLYLPMQGTGVRLGN